MKHSDPDPATVQIMQSIKQNPNFLKLLSFSLNCLLSQVYLPNIKHRQNCRYVHQEFETLMLIMGNHSTSDIIIQHGCQIVNRMIGIHKFREQQRANYVIESKLCPLIGVVLHRQITVESMRSILDLLQNLNHSQQVSDALGRSSCLQGLIKMIVQCKPPNSEMRRVFDTEYKLLVQPIVMDAIGYVELANELMGLLLEYSESAYIVREGLRLIILLVNNENALKQIKAVKALPVQQLTTVLIQHSEMDINEKGAVILERIITDEDIMKCIASVKSVDQDVEYSMGLLACLVPVVYKKNDICGMIMELIGLHKKLIKRRPIIRDALVAASRLVDQDAMYIDMMQNIYGNCLELFESDDSEVASAAFELARRIGLKQSTENLIKLVERTLSAMSGMKGVKEGLKLLLSVGQGNEKVLKAVSKGKEVYIKIVESQAGQSTQEYNGKVMLAVYMECKEYFSKKAVLILQCIQRHSNWHQMANLYMRLLYQLSDAIQSLRKQNILLTVCSMLYGKDYVVQLQEQSDQDEYDSMDEEYGVEVGMSKVNEIYWQMLGVIVKQEDIKQLHKEFVDECNKFVGEQNSLHLEIAIVKLAYAVRVEGVYYLQCDYYSIFRQLLHKVLLVQNYNKTDIINAVFRLISNISQHYYNLQSQVIYKKYRASTINLDILFELLDNEELLNGGLDALIAIGGGDQHIQQVKECINDYQLLDIEDEQYVIQLVSQLQVFMKKYQHKDEIQLKLLRVIKMFMLSELFKKNIRDLPKLLCRKLQESSKEYGIQSIEIMMQAQYSDGAMKQATLFSLEHQYDVDVMNSVTPYLQQIEKYEIDGFMGQIKQDIIDMIEYLHEFDDNEQAADYLDKLSVYANIDTVLQFEIDNNIGDVLVDILQYCTQQLNSDRHLCSSIHILDRMLPRTMQQQLCWQNLQLRQHSYDPVAMLSKYLAHSHSICTIEQVQLLLGLLEEYKQYDQICDDIRHILFHSCRESKEVRDIVGERRVINRIIRSTNESIVDQSGEQQVQQNLYWLINLSQNNDIAMTIYQEQGQSLCDLIINNNYNKYIDNAYQLLVNLISNANVSVDIQQCINRLQQQKDIKYQLDIIAALLINPNILQQAQQNQQLIQLIQQQQESDIVNHILSQLIVEQEVVEQQVVVEQVQNIEQQQQSINNDHETTSPPLILQNILQQAINTSIIDEGMLQQLFTLPQSQDVWQVFSQLSNDPVLAQQLLQPDSKLYVNTLQQLETPEYPNEVLNTAGNISNVAPTLDDFSRTQGPQQMMDILNQQSDDVSIVCAGLQALSKICADETILYTLGDNQGLELQKSLLDKYPDNQEVVLKCQELIKQLSISESYQDKIQELGILQQMIDVIVNNQHSPDVVESGVLALAQVVYKNPSNSEIVVNSQVLPTLLNNIHSTAVDQATAQLITNLVYKNDDIKSKINVDFMVKLYIKHIDPLNKHILTDCVKSLFGLASIDCNANRMIELDIMQAITSLILKYSESYDIILQSLNLQLRLLQNIQQQQYTPTESQINSLLICITIDQLEQAALRILRQYMQSNDITQFYYANHGPQRTLIVLKRSDHSSSYQALDLINKIVKSSDTTIFEQCNIAIELEDLLRTHTTNIKLFDEIIDLAIILKNPTQPLIDQVFQFYQSNTLNDVQIRKVLMLLERGNSDNYILPLLILMQRTPNPLVSTILARTNNPNSLYLNKAVDVSIQVLKTTRDPTINVNLIKVITDVATYLEEYRQEIATAQLPALLNINEPLLAPLIALLKAPKKHISLITDETKEQLIKGDTFKLYKEDGSRGYLRMYFNNSLTTLNCKRDKDKQVKRKWVLAIKDISSIKDDYDKKSIAASPFENQNWFVKTLHKMKGKIVDPERCFSLIAKKDVKPKQLNILCKSQAQRKKWVEQINLVMSEIDQLIQVQ